MLLFEVLIIYQYTWNLVISKSAGASYRNKHMSPNAGLKGFPGTYTKNIRKLSSEKGFLSSFTASHKGNNFTGT